MNLKQSWRRRLLMGLPSVSPKRRNTGRFLSGPIVCPYLGPAGKRKRGRRLRRRASCDIFSRDGYLLSMFIGLLVEDWRTRAHEENPFYGLKSCLRKAAGL